MKEQQKNEKQESEVRTEISTAFQPKGPRDGLDNTGTQGADSLKDDGYTGSASVPDDEHEDGTGSSSEDFKDKHGQIGSDNPVSSDDK